MNDWRTKIAVLAVVLGLGGLGGYAMSSNRKVTNAAATTSSTPATKVIRRTIHKKPKHQRSAGGNPGATAARSLTSAPVSSGSSGSSSSPPVSTGSSGSGGGGAVHTGTSGSGGGESEGGGEHEGGGGGGD